ETLDAGLQRGWSRRNPVDLLGDADGPRYARALEALLADGDTDAVLAIHVPTVLSPPLETARAMADTLRATRGKARRKPTLAVWMGGDGEATRVLGEAGVPTYATEAEAVRGFMYLARHRQA